MSVQKILVVDDSRTVRAIVVRALAEAGYEVITAADGVEAVERAKSDRPDLAVLDICMPFMDGYAVCDELKKLGEPLSRLPIVFLTTVESHALELLGSSLGAYLQKPVQAEELLKVVKGVIGDAGSRTLPTGLSGATDICANQVMTN